MSEEEKTPYDSKINKILELENKGLLELAAVNKKELDREILLNVVSDDKKINKISLFTRRGQLEEFWKEHPFYYDTAKIFWLWDKQKYRWVMSDEVDFCNLIFENLGINTLNSKERIEIVEGFKQIGRLHKPKDMKKSFIQFQDRIYDVQTDENFEASPEWFVTNPIPWRVGESAKCPTIDRLFIEWVGEENKQQLDEITAYTLSLDKFMQRLFALVGGGSNGKGTFIKLLYKFLGEDNCVSSEIKLLSEDKFEPAVLFRKLLCVFGEVSYDDLKNTNMLKKLGGEDKISFQFKGKTPFTADNTATGMSLTNTLPTTPDKSLGFYRKWLIIDFPNQFNGINKDIIAEIPEIEFENLAFRCLNILKSLYETKKFTNEGTFQERMERYEERSNPIMKFMEKYCAEDAGCYVSLRRFANKLNEYLKSKHLRVMTANQVGKCLREEGFLVGNRKIDDISQCVILNLKLLELLELSRLQLVSHIETNRKMDSFDSLDSSSKVIENPSSGIDGDDPYI